MKSKRIIGISTLTTIAVAAIVAIAIVAMRGETKITGQNPADIKSKSLICENTSIRYPILDYKNVKSTKIKTTLNFYENDLNAISLEYTQYVDNSKQVVGIEAANHADMNISFAKSGYGVDAFSVNYAMFDNSVRMSLYASNSEIDKISAKYFMIDMNSSIPNDINGYRKNYEEQSFVCEVK